jgi:RNA polymerase sigma-70 factor, ECF subfamily
MEHSLTITAMPQASATSSVQEEFDEIFLRYRSQVFRFLLSLLRDRDTAETLTQECFLRAFRAWPNFRQESNPLTWLMRIAVNLTRDHWRNRKLQFWKRAASVEISEVSDWLPGKVASPEQRALARQQVEAVWKVVEELSPRQKTVFLLRFVEEMELSEIAEATGLNLGTVKSHLSRGLNAVRTRIGRQS